MSTTTDHDLLVAIDAKVSTLLASADDHETRLRTLESNSAAQTVKVSIMWAVGAVAGTSMITSLIAMVATIVTSR